MTWEKPKAPIATPTESGFVAPVRKMGRPPITPEQMALIETAKREVRFGMDIGLAAIKIHVAYFGISARTEHGFEAGQLKYLRSLIRR